MSLINLKNYLLEHEKKTFYDINIFLNCSKNVVDDKLDNVNKILSVLSSNNYTNNYKNKNIMTQFYSTISNVKETPLPTYYDKTLITEKGTPIKTKIYETILNTNSDLQTVNKFSTSMINNPINADTKSTNATIKNSITSNESGKIQGSSNPYLYNFHKKQVSGNNPVITNIIAKAKLSMISNNSLKREKSNVKENTQISKISLTNFNKTINNNSNTNTPLTTILNTNNYFQKEKTPNIINNSPCLKVKRSFSGNSTLKKRNYSEEKIAKDKNNKIGIKITKLKEKVISNNTANTENNGYSTFANITISNFRKTQTNILPTKQLQTANGMKNIFIKNK
jgi:hypothetical protein